MKIEDLGAFKELIQMKLEDLWGSKRVHLGIGDLWAFEELIQMEL